MSDESEKRVGMFITSDPDETSIEQPDADAAHSVSRLPLRLLLVSDLVPQATEVDWTGASRVRRVDKNSFDEVLHELAPRLTIDVPNRISSTPKQWELELGFADLEAFHPVELVQQIPPLAQLLQVRTLVGQVQDGTMDLEAFRTQLGETGVDADWAEQLYDVLSAPPPKPSRPAAPPAASSTGGEDDALDRLMGMVDAGEPSAEEAPPAPAEKTGDPTADLLGSLVGAVAGEAAARPKVEKSAAVQLVDDLDRMLSEQLDAVYNHPAVRKLEAAWRGVKFLVDRLVFRRGVQLEVLAAPKAALSEALYHQVLMPEHQGDTDEPPLSAVLLGYAFDHGNADVALLDDLAETGASLQTPLIASAAPGFFGVSAYSGLTKLPPLWQQFEQPEYIAYNKLREKKEARFLALALPAFLLRSPYGDAQPVKAFQFSETGELWGHAALAVGVSMAESFVETGWPTHLTGMDRRIEDLPTWKSPQGHIPLAALVPDSKLSEFAKGGFVVLSGQTKRDFAFLARAQTVCLPETYEELMAATEARIHVTLACQLFVARAAHYMLLLQDELVVGEDIEALVQDVETRLRAFLHTEGKQVPPEAVSVEHVSEMELPNHEMLAVRLRTPPYVLDRPVSLVMGLQVPKAAST